ncbi:MAG TPA: hypothetical protein VFQ85_12920 [Mycobacteriales bacterium]|jgi:hypothetical protein|nr:hypothetical protein [Mycobacteriales bacterium]
MSGHDTPPNYPLVPPLSAIVESGQHWQEENRRRSDALYRLNQDLTAEQRRQMEQTQQRR